MASVARVASVAKGRPVVRAVRAVRAVLAVTTAQWEAVMWPGAAVSGASSRCGGANSGNGCSFRGKNSNERIKKTRV